MKVNIKNLVVFLGIAITSAATTSVNAQSLENIANPPCHPSDCGKKRRPEKSKADPTNDASVCDLLCRGQEFMLSLITDTKKQS